MSLSHVLLTSLLEKPSTGIALARRFDHSMAYFWHATHQQIYRELKQMLKQGWISPIETQDSDSRKITYQVEASGLAELQQWLTEQSPSFKIRDELMVKLRAEAQIGGNQLLPELKQQLVLHQMQYQMYLIIQAKDQRQSQKMDARTFNIQQKILELGILFEEDWVIWLQEMIELLETQ